MANLKKIGFIIVLAISLVFLYLSWDLEKKQPSPVPLLPLPTRSFVMPSPTPVPAATVSASVFVPYWALGKDNLRSVPENKIYYFGVAIDKNGQPVDDDGYKNLAHVDCPKDKTCILVVRMLDADVNAQVLHNQDGFAGMIAPLITLADSHSFNGIALDLEENTVLSQEETYGNITKFVQVFYTLAKNDYKTFSFIVYGDTYFRKRPFDVKAIAASADEILVMAYDFSKGYGEPGPNFPYDRSEVDAGYDFQEMIGDFSRDVPRDKLAVIFGMYGYDWTLNAQGTPLKRATAITDREIEKLIAGGQTRTITLPVSKEKKIEYANESGSHVIWYEDRESARVKTDYLQKQGIGMVSYWAYGYY